MLLINWWAAIAAIKPMNAKVETTNRRFKFYHLERASPKIVIVF
jgi:hypothetical protein